MAKRSVKAGTTSQREYVFVNDSASTTGGGKTGIAFNASGIKAYYVRPGGSATLITLATQTVTGAYSSGGWVEVDSTNMPGVYRFDVPDAVFAAGVEKAIVMVSGASGMAPVVMEYDLTAYDPYDTVRLGLTAMPNVASGSAGALITSGTGTAQLSVSSGAVTVGTNNDKTGYSLSTAPPTAATIADAVWDEVIGDHLAAGSTGAALNAAGSAGDPWTTTLPGSYTGSQAGKILADILVDTGTTLQAELDGIQADTEDIQSRLPAALVSGRMDASVGAMAANVLTASALATDAVTEIQSGLATTANVAAVETDTQDIQSRLPAALVSGRMDSSVGAMQSNVITASALAADAASEIATATVGATIEGAETLQGVLRLVRAATVGNLSGAASTTITIRDAADTKARITATVDADGNRLAVTTDAT